MIPLERSARWTRLSAPGGDLFAIQCIVRKSFCTSTRTELFTIFIHEILIAYVLWWQVTAESIFYGTVIIRGKRLYRQRSTPEERYFQRFPKMALVVIFNQVGGCRNTLAFCKELSGPTDPQSSTDGCQFDQLGPVPWRETPAHGTFFSP